MSTSSLLVDTYLAIMQGDSTAFAAAFAVSFFRDVLISERNRFHRQQRRKTQPSVRPVAVLQGYREHPVLDTFLSLEISTLIFQRNSNKTLIHCCFIWYSTKIGFNQRRLWTFTSIVPVFAFTFSYLSPGVVHYQSAFSCRILVERVSNLTFGSTFIFYYLLFIYFAGFSFLLFFIAKLLFLFSFYFIRLIPVRFLL